jgi:hypothetical protein
MYKVKLHSGEYTMPSCWDEVTFEQLLKLKEMNYESSMGNIFATSLMFASLIGCDYREISKLPKDSFIEMANACKWIMKFEVERKFNKEFEIDGVKYSIVPDFNNLNIGEMASVEQLSIEGVEKNLDKILAIVVREVGEDGEVVEFDASTLDARALVFRKKLTLPEVYGLSDFFLAGRETYLKNTQGSSTVESIIQKM